ncbi:MAG: trypsin-like peptidase domain-containing protein, partial [Chloroflexi bacterium]|nr:trypsin-like peptidase domain-containing protein [Chloroflexota bacterium]
MQALGSRTRQAQALGTGVIVDAKGYIVTNNHVVEGAKQLEVLFENGSKADAQLIGTDPFSDLAVVRVTGRAMPAVATLGDSAVLQVGEPVIAIGSALGDFKNTVTVGVVSGLNRRLGANDASAIEGLIQTDAAINHGNSGGPLLNAAGQVVGINTLVVRNDGGGDVAEGLGFAIPVNLVKTVSGQLIARGKVTRPFLGVSYVPLNPQLAAANDLSVKAGAWVQEVTAGSPAARAGLKAGDVLTAIGDQTLDDDTPLVSALIKHQPGETVPLTIWRGGQTLTLNVTLIERQSS